jgi:hypothetical protein
MSQTHKNGSTPARAATKAVRKKTSAALTRTHARRASKAARATVKGLPGRTKRFITSNPVRVLLGATALGLVLAKLRHII